MWAVPHGFRTVWIRIPATMRRSCSRLPAVRSNHIYRMLLTISLRTHRTETFTKRAAHKVKMHNSPCSLTSDLVTTNIYLHQMLSHNGILLRKLLDQGHRKSRHWSSTILSCRKRRRWNAGNERNGVDYGTSSESTFKAKSRISSLRWGRKMLSCASSNSSTSSKNKRNNASPKSSGIIPNQTTCPLMRMIKTIATKVNW